jgi:hypothetical protein
MDDRRQIVLDLAAVSVPSPTSSAILGTVAPSGARKTISLGSNRRFGDIIWEQSFSTRPRVPRTRTRLFYFLMASLTFSPACFRLPAA